MLVGWVAVVVVVKKATGGTPRNKVVVWTLEQVPQSMDDVNVLVDV